MYFFTKESCEEYNIKIKRQKGQIKKKLSK
jgi:hypothetical protein